MVGQLRDVARKLRREQTEWERLLWAKLRDRRVDGLKFRRQRPIGPYVADFVCEEAMLIVELDGLQHGEEADAVRDAARTSYLNSCGYDVIRVWNEDVTTNIDGVLSGIYAAAKARVERSPSSALRAPSPVPGEEK